MTDVLIEPVIMANGTHEEATLAAVEPKTLAIADTAKLGKLIFVDTETTGACPGVAHMTEFGAVHFESGATFHGVLHPSIRPSATSATAIITGDPFDAYQVFSDFRDWIYACTDHRRATFVSDNLAFDWQWINHGFHTTLGENPFGFSGRRINDFYAGLTGDFLNQNAWKRLRITSHDHNPVNDALGNAEAFRRILEGER